jgi:IS605 OrfB family transposase
MAIDIADRGQILRIRRRNVATDLTAAKRAELTELARRCSNARQRFVDDYWDARHVRAILSEPRRLAEDRRDKGWPETGLSPHQNKVCLETALAILRGSWVDAIRKATTVVTRDPRLSLADRTVAYAVLASPLRLARCLDDDLGNDAEAINPSLRRRIRRIVLAARPGKPRLNNKLWFDLDCNLYRPFARPDDRHFRGAWISVTGLTRGQRIKVPLAGSNLGEFTSRTDRPESRPNVRVEIGGRIVLHVVERMACRKASGSATAGVDKGFKTLVTLSRGEVESARGYGSSADALIAAIADTGAERLRQRRRLGAYERSIRARQSKRARRIRRRSLGTVGANRRVDRDRAFLRQQVDTALNALFVENSDLALLAVEDLAFPATRLSRSLNRRLGRWLKGYLQERLAYKAELNGVELKVVSAAYTSQTCPRCWFTSEKNRRGDRFECGYCGLTGSADAIAATNVLRRGSDPAVTRHTPRAEVRRILEERWQSARNGRARGSNSGVSRQDERE